MPDGRVALNRYLTSDHSTHISGDKVFVYNTWLSSNSHHDLSKGDTYDIRPLCNINGQSYMKILLYK